MKVLFLDIDGVLNNHAWLMTEPARMIEIPPDDRGRPVYYAGRFNPDLVSELNRVIDETGANIVISSSWRIMGGEMLTNVFELVGIKGKIIGLCTGDDMIDPKTNLFLGAAQRGTLIRNWLDLNGERWGVTQWAVVDDSGDMDKVRDRFVQTDFTEGLTRENADDLISLLSETP